MKSLVIFSGGHSFRNDDLIYIQDAAKDGFKALLNAFAINNSGFYIISGCVLTLTSSTSTQDNYSLTEGWICYDYEIMYCPAQTLTTAKNAGVQGSVEIINSTPRPYRNGNTYFVNRNRQFKIVELFTQGSDFPYPKIADAIAELSNVQYVETYLTNLAVMQNSWTDTGSNTYVQKDGNLKILNVGEIRSSTTWQSGAVGTTQVAMILPTEFRPKKDVVFTIVGIVTTGTYGSVLIKIATNGDVLITKTETNTPTFLSFTLSYF